VLKYEQKATQAIALQLQQVEKLEEDLKKAKLELGGLRCIHFWSRKALQEQMPSTSYQR
jgi:hypothetical protein